MIKKHMMSSHPHPKILYARAQRNAGVKGMTIEEVRQRVDDRINAVYSQ